MKPRLPISSLRHAGKDLDRAFESVAVDEPFHGQGGAAHHRLVRVVAFAMSRRSLDQRIVIGDSRLLRLDGKPVDIRHETDHRMARAIGCDEGCGHAGDTPLDREALFLQ